MTSGSELGAIGEAAATLHLRGRGYKILATNFKRPFGEIDIVAQDGAEIVFAEVKSSWHVPESSFLPEYRVDRKKIRNLKKICQAYLSEIRASDERKWRIDTISVIVNSDRSIRGINHIEHAVFEDRY